MIKAVENYPLQDPLEQALWDWHRGEAKGSLLLHAYGLEGIPLAEEPQVVSPEVFFTQELPEVEAMALDLCRGRVLDIGAGTGRHSLLLQEEGLAVAALDRSPVALQIMAERGVRCRIAADLFHWAGPGEPFDTLLLLMNGVGLAGSLSGLERFLRLARHWVQPTGQLLLDSTDLSDASDLADLRNLPAEEGGRLENLEDPSGKLARSCPPRSRWLRRLAGRERGKSQGSELCSRVQRPAGGSLSLAICRSGNPAAVCPRQRLAGADCLSRAGGGFSGTPHPLLKDSLVGKDLG
jgi:SAM-dependent methyltransferase